MASTSLTSTNAYSTVDSEAGSIDWSNVIDVNSVFQYSEVQITPSQVSDYALASNLGFSIPGVATINGIVVSINRSAAIDQSIKDYKAYLFNSGSTIGASRATASFWSDSPTSVTYGSPTDKWDYSSLLSPSVVNSSTFGFGLSVQWGDVYPAGSATAYYEAGTEITVYYTINGIKLGSTSIVDLRVGNNQISRVYQGSSDLTTVIVIP